MLIFCRVVWQSHVVIALLLLAVNCDFSSWSIDAFCSKIMKGCSKPKLFCLELGENVTQCVLVFFFLNSSCHFAWKSKIAIWQTDSLLCRSSSYCHSAWLATALFVFYGFPVSLLCLQSKTAWSRVQWQCMQHARFNTTKNIKQLKFTHSAYYWMDTRSWIGLLFHTHVCQEPKTIRSSRLAKLQLILQ